MKTPNPARARAPWARCLLLAALAGAAAGSGSARAALVLRGGGLIYDTVLNVTWLADMNHAQTQYQDSGGALGTANGHMDWAQANLWAAGLDYGGYSDWRLPTTLQPDASCSSQADPGNGAGTQSSGTGCTGSEMGHLFYADLGGRAGESLLDPTGDSAQELANLALFTNVADDFGAGLFWSATAYAPAPGAAWMFYMSSGLQSALNTGFQLRALAVRDGDSGSQVPEPSTALLAGAALLLALKARARR